MDYPASSEFNAPLKVGRWRVIGNMILSIPHMIMLYVLGAFSLIVDVFSWLAIVFSGKLPAGLAGVNCMLIRYNARVGTFLNFMRSSYPPFDFDTSAQDNGNDPEVVVNISPGLEGRNRLSVFFRFILLIPIMIVGLVGDFGLARLGRWVLRRADPRPLARGVAQFLGRNQPLQCPDQCLQVSAHRQIPSPRPELIP